MLNSGLVILKKSCKQFGHSEDRFIGYISIYWEDLATCWHSV